MEFIKFSKIIWKFWIIILNTIFSLQNFLEILIFIYENLHQKCINHPVEILMKLGRAWRKSIKADYINSNKSAYIYYYKNEWTNRRWAWDRSPLEQEVKRRFTAYCSSRQMSIFLRFSKPTENTLPNLYQERKR